MNCHVELLECGHTDCPIHHRCDCVQRAGCGLRDDVDDGDYIAERIAERDDMPDGPYDA
jgi:hypothetical protein